MKKVLIIEDELSIANLVSDYLEVYNMDSEIALTGRGGKERAESNDYDLILLDLMLPDIDGFDLCIQLRRTLDIPIVMVTARKEDIDKIRGFDRGADDYIVKPFNPNELVARVKAHISRYERLVQRDQELDEIQVKDLYIDLSARRIFINTEEKICTAKEFDLLVFLARHPNRVFTKEELFEKIWNFDSMGDISTITVHIRKIREKIEQDPSNTMYIETVWGVGYRFKK